jgi:Fe-S-cluster formation regulator IscX/YfhJ
MFVTKDVTRFIDIHESIVRLMTFKRIVGFVDIHEGIARL